MPIDVTDFAVDGKKPKKADDFYEGERRWWTLAPNDAAKSIAAQVRLLQGAQAYRTAQHKVSARL